MLDFVIGTKAKPAAVDNLLDSLRRMKPADGIVYVGFPVVATESETSTIDALFTSSRFGVVVFDLLDSPPSPDAWEEIEERQSRLVAGLTSRLLLHKDLRKGPQLAFVVHVVTYSPNRVRPPKGKELTVARPDNLQTVLDALPTFPPKLLLHLNAALQSVSTIKPRKKRSLVKGSSTRGAILKEIEKNIANLDRWQRQGAIETPEGPQRIRGLAGAGKTIVLALKAAYLHAQHPDWTIGVTFYTRSLYQQFRDLIRRFYFDQQRDEPDWTRLRILHAWGSPRDPGVYSEIANALRRPLEDFASARTKHGMEKPFEGICAELLTATAGHAFEPIFDALLIDEAQDLPVPFFRLAYHATRDPKRIVWAYDELQNLGTYSMAPPEELFGTTADGSPLITLRNIDGAPHQDVILPVCYRNTPWALATAHALGFGVYRPEGLVQFFDDPALWTDIGYEVATGDLTPGAHVSLARRADCSPGFFAGLLRPTDAVESHVFRDAESQLKWVVKSIKQNLDEDELEPDDILVIFPDPLTASRDAAPLIAALGAAGTPAHVVGIASSRDEVFFPHSIAISGIRRAKGNEAPMVYVLNCEYCFGGAELIRKRNTLFTAITRSRAWVRMCGSGSTMGKLDEEVKRVVQSEYRLQFDVPTEEELTKIRQIHRDMTIDERRLVIKAADALDEFLERVEAGELSVEHLPPAIRSKLKELLGGSTSR